MGRRNRGGQKRGRTMRKHFKDGRENVWKKSRAEGDNTQGSNNATWEPFVMENLLFEEYYKEQGILSENEWDTFLATLKSPLPAVFRVNSSGQFAMAVKDRIQQEFVEARKAESEVDGSAVDLIKPISWYPEKLAWQLNFSRMQLRKNQKLAQIHEFLKQENETGIITRQEAVSMLPPLLLDVQPHHHILDMCAAPGSKTFQLLEMIHQKGLISEGLVIANDLDVQRCHLLVHQTKRMCSPNAIVTNHEAQHFPLLKKKKKHVQLLQDDSIETITVEDEDRGLLFDRVLCDVPCSGDGTIRKAPDIWKKWNSGIGNGLHRLQVQITLRGVALLKVGGRIVYSTCSLNPVEDEAVVAEVLRRTEGCLELLDASQELPSLKFRPGLKTWKVKDRGQWLVSYRQVNKHRAMSIVPGMFPSGQRTDETASRPKEIPNSDKDLMPTKELAKENCEQSVADVLEESSPQAIVEGTEVSTLPLERCMRILPHDQDTGGFFIAVFKKIKPWSVEQKPTEVSVPKQIGSRTHSAGEANEVSLKSDYPDSNTSFAEGSMLIDPKHEDAEAVCMVEKTALVDSQMIDNSDIGVESIKSNCEEKQQLETSVKEENQKQSDPSLNGSSDDFNKVIDNSDKGVENIESNCEKKQQPEAFVKEENQKPSDPSLNGCGDGLNKVIDTSDTGVENIKSNCEEKQQPEASVNEENQKQSDPSLNGVSKGLNKDPGQKVQSKTQQQGNWKGVDPVIILSDEEIIKSLIDFYGIHEDFNLRGRLVTRSDDTKRVKRIYHISEPVRDVILRNYMSGDQLKIVSVGLKLFERQAGKEDFSPCLFRLSSEGLPIILPYLTKQVAVASKAVFELLLSNRVVSFTSFKDDNFSTAIEALLPGCCVIILDSQVTMNVNNSKPEQSIAIGCWRGRNNLSLLVSKVEAEQLLQKLGCKKEGPTKSPEDAVMATESEEELKETAVEKDVEEASETGDPDENDDCKIVAEEL